jgi:hypothetical protein
LAFHSTIYECTRPGPDVQALKSEVVRRRFLGIQGQDDLIAPVVSRHNETLYALDRSSGQRLSVGSRAMKKKTKHRKAYAWRKRADSSPVAKGRRKKRLGVRNPSKVKFAGGKKKA